MIICANLWYLIYVFCCPYFLLLFLPLPAREIISSFLLLSSNNTRSLVLEDDQSMVAVLETIIKTVANFCFTFNLQFFFYPVYKKNIKHCVFKYSFNIHYINVYTLNEYVKWGSVKISVNLKAYLFIGHHDTSRVSVTPDIHVTLKNTPPGNKAPFAVNVFLSL